MRHRIVLFLVLFLVLPLARAQAVRWEASDSGSSAVQLVFEDCAPDGAPELPSVPGFTFTKIGESSSTNIVNFDVHRSVILTYLVRARQNAAIQIPAFSVKTNKGLQRVAAFNAAAPAASAVSVASSKLVPERTNVWAGEIFGLTYEITIASRVNPSFSSWNLDWNPAPLTTEDWTKPEASEDTVGGERRLRVVVRTRAMSKMANTLKLEAANQVVNIQTGTVGFGFFTQSRMEPVSVTSDQPVLTVRPLPAGAPAGFGGAVGQFELLSKVVPENAAVGEPITWTLELRGTGNWPDIAGLPTRDVSTDFQVVQPKAKRTPADGKLFDVTLAEDVVLVPSKPGTYTLGPVSFVYFDPRSGTYKASTVKARTVTIGAPATPKFNFNVAQPAVAAPPAAAPSTPAEPTAAQLETLKSKIPAPPAGIPRDPLPGRAVAAAPLALRTWVIWLLSPVLCPLLVWLWLALRRAHRTDPLRPRREARARLAKTLAQLRTAQPAARNPQLLLAWQRDTAVLWQIAHAAPPASALTDAAWTQLWLDCDRALYGAKTQLPSDWTARAEAALEAKRVPGFNPLRAGLPRNLFPFAALAAFLLLVPCSLLLAAAVAAGDGASLYRRGDFAAAEKSWRAALASAPTDWIARHNLSLALSQQERTSEAAAHAAAAFVQHPAAPAVRWHLILASEKAGFTPAPLAPFLTPGPAQSLAERASPADWQRVLVGAALAIALALSWLLVNAYGRRARIVGWLAGAVMAMAVLVGGTAVAGWQAYGIAADARAVVVLRAGTLRSIPTEADTAQKTTPLAAGSVAIAESAFLDSRWTRLRFDNGQTGWVRTGELIGLWR